MGFPHPDVLHGASCDCTLHDFGLSCRRKLTAEDLAREIDEVVTAALRSGIAANDVVQAVTRSLERHRSLEARG